MIYTGGVSKWSEESELFASAGYNNNLQGSVNIWDKGKSVIKIAEPNYFYGTVECISHEKYGDVYVLCCAGTKSQRGMIRLFDVRNFQSPVCAYNLNP